MKIVFVETPSPWIVRQNAQVALGLLYLATVLKEEDYEVRVARPKDKEDFINFWESDVICMSGTTLEYPMNVECAKWVRSHFPNIKIFIGGPHVTAMWQEVMKTGLFDSICVGEGERVILKMMEDLKRHSLKAIYFSNYHIENLDEIPFPDRSLIEGSHGGNVFAYNENYIGSGNETFLTSRGCPFNCAFCASSVMWNGVIKFRSIENIVSEVGEIIESTGTRQLRICDDNLTSNKKRCLMLCKAFKDINFVWRCSIRAETLSVEICEAMAEAKCKEVSVGIESGDQRVLNFLNKRTTIEKMKEGCKNAKKAGMKVRPLFMIGTPGEMPNTPEINRDYINELDFDMISLTTFSPFPGTPIWNNPETYYCTILSEDFREYNVTYWVMKDGKKIKKKYEPLIHNKILTISQMKDNVERMQRYIEETGKYNEG